MKKLISEYTTSLDELNVLTSVSYNRADGEDIPEKVAQIVDDILSYLIYAYTLGIDHASAMLDYALSADVGRMDEAIYLRIDGKTFADRADAHIRDKNLSGLKTLVESEFHRVYNRAVHDGGEEVRRREGVTVLKNWVTVRDDKVRDTHEYLEGQSVALDGEFYTYDGDHTFYPGGFTKVSNNVNCRCIVRLSRG